MAAVSAAHTTTTTTLTPPSSSHGNQGWNYSASGRAEIPAQEKAIPNNDYANRSPLVTQNGNTTTTTTTSYNLNADAKTHNLPSAENIPPLKASKSLDAGYLSPPYGKDASAKMGGTGTVNGLADLYSEGKSVAVGSDNPGGLDDEGSKWIHRDKLARIESEELQAAGIILPRGARQPFKPRHRESRHPDTHEPKKAAETPEQTPAARSRKNSVAAEQRPSDISVPSWDLRLPEEIAAEANSGFWTPPGLSKGASKIPVAKISPVPIPLDYLERESPSVRKHNSTSSGDADTIAYPKPRARSASMRALESTGPSVTPAKRSATDTSPKKNAAIGPRKASTASKNPPPGARPKTRSGPNKDSTSSSSTRPSTRSGELSPNSALNRHPEGDPPWMVSAYQPDPRLPPEQQLLPTVARRLQQEKWEKEGKFGNIYDKEFRPLTDEGFLQPPERRYNVPAEEERQQSDEWPLKGEPPRSPTLKHGGSYSTMPKIQDKPTASPLPSPIGAYQHQQLSAQEIVRLPDQEEQPDEPRPKKGCGCCIVM